MPTHIQALQRDIYRSIEWSESIVCHIIGIAAGLLCVTNFCMESALAPANVTRGKHIARGVYVSAYSLWVVYFLLHAWTASTYNDPMPRKAHILGKLLACTMLLVKGILVSGGVRVDTRFINMAASMLFLTSSTIYGDGDTWASVFGKLGSTILLSTSLAALKSFSFQGAIKENVDQLEWAEFNCMVAFGFALLTISVHKTYQQSNAAATAAQKRLNDFLARATATSDGNSAEPVIRAIPKFRKRRGKRANAEALGAIFATLKQMETFNAGRED